MKFLEALQTGRKITSDSLINEYTKNIYIQLIDGLFFDETGVEVELYASNLKELFFFYEEEWRFYDVEFKELSIGDKFKYNGYHYMKADNLLAVYYRHPNAANRFFAEFSPTQLVEKE